MPTDVNKNKSNTTTNGSKGFTWNEKLNSDGTDPDPGDGSTDGEDGDETGDNTEENVEFNDPEKNKKLAEITMT